MKNLTPFLWLGLPLVMLALARGFHKHPETFGLKPQGAIANTSAKREALLQRAEACKWRIHPSTLSDKDLNDGVADCEAALNAK